MRLRVTFAKTGPLRYTGHLDLHKVWERSVLRAGLPLVYSQGFHPGPRLQLACALPLGFAGREEIVDLWLEEPGDLPFRELLQAAVPPGLEVLRVEQVDPQAPALQTRVASSVYLVTLLDPLETAVLQKDIAALLACDSLPREWRNKPYDLRGRIESLELLPAEGSATVRLAMQLSAREAATGRPEEVLAALGIPFENTFIERTRLILKNDLE